ncbi:MAG: four helix bundle protein [Gemmatimonas sp.]
MRIDGVWAQKTKRRRADLVDQLTRAANSVSSNLAEGCAHSSRREFARFVQMSLASCGEVAHHLKFARDTRAISIELFADLESACREVRRMLASLLRKVRDELTETDDDESIAAMQSRRFKQRHDS